eukprot:47982-Amorphochlora_amoeboformis.AAC.2
MYLFTKDIITSPPHRPTRVTRDTQGMGLSLTSGANDGILLECGLTDEKQLVDLNLGTQQSHITDITHNALKTA